jgi:adenylosuccinate synthase
LAGKSTIARYLEDEWGYVLLSARSVLRELSPVGLQTRAELQRFGLTLEVETGGAWLGEAATRTALAAPHRPIVVDSARTVPQVSSVRSALVDVRHVHVRADRAELEARFARGDKDLVDAPSFDEAMSHLVERNIDDLAQLADVVVDSSSKAPTSLFGELQRLVPLV